MSTPCLDMEEESVRIASSDILRIKIALAFAIIKNCPTNITPEMYARQLSTKRCYETVISLQKEQQLTEECNSLRQKLINNNLEMDEILFLKKRGRKRKDDISHNQIGDIHSEMLNKVKTDYLAKMNDTLNSQHLCYKTEPHKAHQFLTTFLNLREQTRIDTKFTSTSYEEKILTSIQAIEFLFDEIFWTDKEYFMEKNTNISSALMLNSYNKIVQTIGNVIEMLSSTLPSCLQAKNPVSDMLRRIIEKLKLFIWNIINCSNFELVEKSWKLTTDRLLSLSKCGVSLNWCSCHALVEIIFMISLHMRATDSKANSITDARSSKIMDSIKIVSCLESHLLENSARIFFLLEGILSMAPRDTQSDLKKSTTTEAKRLLNLSLLHAVETYPLFTIRIWEVMNLL